MNLISVVLPRSIMHVIKAVTKMRATNTFLRAATVAAVKVLADISYYNVGAWLTMLP